MFPWMRLPDSDRELPDGPYTALLLGWMVPLFLGGCGLIAIINHKGIIPDRYGGLLLTGANAIALGMACIGGSFALHCNYIWDRTKYLSGLASAGQATGLLIFIASTAYLIWKVAILGA